MSSAPTVSVHAGHPGPLRAWLAASRPATLGAALAPVAVGSACASAVGAFAAGPALAALLGAMFLQVGANFANDVFDHEKGADNSDRIGPARSVQAGWISAAAMRRGMVVVFSLAALTGLYLAWVAGPIVLLIGVFSITAAIAYTGGPYPLGYHGLGDVFVFVFFGLVAVTGTAFVQMGSVPPLAWVAAAAPGSLATAILVVNNLRDRHTDAAAGKRTLAVRFGRRVALIEYALLLGIAYTVLPVLALLRESWWPMVALVTLPEAVRLLVRLREKEGAALNPLLPATARLLVLHSLALSLGLAGW